MAKGIATVQTPSSSGGGGGAADDVEDERERLAREAIEGKRAELSPASGAPAATAHG